MIMRKLIFALFLLSGFAIAVSPEPDVVGYSVSYSVPPNSGFFLCDDSPETTITPGEHAFSFTLTNRLKTVTGLIVNGSDIKMGSGPWSLTVSDSLTLSILLSNSSPVEYFTPDGIISLEIPCTSYWQKLVFGSPKSVKFYDDGKSFLCPSAPNSVLVSACGGNLLFSTSTNSYEVVSTLGDNATVPNGPIFLSDGQTLTINRQISRLFLKGNCKAVITVVKE